MIALLLASALAGSPCLDAELVTAVPAGVETFDPRPTDTGLELDEPTYERWLWSQRRLLGCLIELRASLLVNERTEAHIKWVEEHAADSIKRARPTWMQRNGFTIGIIVGGTFAVAILAGLAASFKFITLQE